MKHSSKILSAILALTLVLTSNIVPAMACTLEGADPNEEIPVIADEYLDEDGNPIVIPCEHVKKYGYCSTAHTFVWLTEDGSLRLYVNPYPTFPTGDTDDSTSDGLSAVIGATPDGERIGGSIPSEPDKPAETAPVETAPTAALAADVTVTEVVPPKYDRVGDFSEGFAWVVLNKKVGFVDKTGKEVVPCKYDEVYSFSEGFARVRLDNKWGFIDTTGKEVVPLKYDEAYSFSEGLAAVRVGEYPDYMWGFIDMAGKEVVPCGKYDSVDSFSDGLALVSQDGKHGFIDKAGKEIIPCTLEYDRIDSFSEGLAAVHTGDLMTGKWGFIDKTGKEVVSLENNYFSVGSFDHGLAPVRTSTWGFIDKTGKEVIPCRYSDQHGRGLIATNSSPVFSDGAAAMNVVDYTSGYESYKYGVIDIAGKEIVPLGKYDYVADFSDGLAAVCDENGKWGFVDKTGTEVIPCQYEGSFNGGPFFSDGLAAVKLDGKRGFIDKTGKEMVPCKYINDNPAHPSEFHEGLAAVCDENGKWGFISVNGAAAPVQPVETEPTQRFADVAPGAWYYDAVNTMGLNGILNGYPDGLFHPDDYMTEAEMLTVIYRLATTDEPWKKLSDKPGYKKHWAIDVIASLDWTHALACYTTIGVTEADEYALRGEANMALIALLTEANRLSYDRDTDTWSSNYYTKVHDWTQDNNPIPDWDAIAAGRPEGTSEWTPHEWSANRILAAYNFGLVSGKDTAGTFDPAGHLTRAEFCQMLYNAGITECLHVTMNISDWGYGG